MEMPLMNLLCWLIHLLYTNPASRRYRQNERCEMWKPALQSWLEIDVYLKQLLKVSKILSISSKERSLCNWELYWDWI